MPDRVLCDTDSDCELWQICLEQYDKKDQYHIDWTSLRSFCVAASPENNDGHRVDLSKENPTTSVPDEEQQGEAESEESDNEEGTRDTKAIK